MKERPELTPFGLTVRMKLLEKKMTQVELAAALGIEKQYLYKILHGMKSEKKYAEKMIQILGIDWAQERREEDVCNAGRSGRTGTG